MLQTYHLNRNLRYGTARSVILLHTRKLFAIGVFCLGAISLSGCSGYSEQNIITEPGRVVRPRVTTPAVQEKWRYLTKVEQAAAQRVVQEQLRAFRDRDYKKALALETPDFAASFPTPASLRNLIEGDYPVFNRAQSIQWRRAMFKEATKTMLIVMRFTTTQGEIIDVYYTLNLSKNKFLISGISPRTIRERQSVENPWPFRPAF